MSPKRFMGRLNREIKFRRLDLLNTRDNLSGADRPREHYFKLFRAGDDVCAKCGKPRAEHPKRKP
jgi:hypothetical protein